MRTAQIVKSVATVVVLGVFGAMAFLMDTTNMFLRHLVVTPDLSQIDGLVTNSLYLMALAVVVVWNIDWESADKSVGIFCRPVMALFAYSLAYFHNGLTILGTPTWVFPALGWTVMYLAPIILIVDLVLGIWIYKKKE